MKSTFATDSIAGKGIRILKILLFLALFIYLYIHITYVLNPYDEKEEPQKEMAAGFYAEEENSIDVVFFGSSAVNEYYAPPLIWKEYGFTSYLFSNATQKPEYTLYLIDEVLKTQSPKVIVLEPRIFLFSPEATQEESVHYFNRLLVDNLKLSVNRLKLIREEYEETAPEDYLPLIRYHENWKQFTFSDLGYWNDEKLSSRKGFLFYEDHADKIVPQEYTDRSSDEEAWPIAGEREQQLRAILEHCNEKGVQVLVAVSPYCVGSDDHKYYNYIGNITQEYGQVSRPEPLCRRYGAGLQCGYV